MEPLDEIPADRVADALSLDAAGRAATGTLATGASFRGTEDPQPSKIDLDFYRSPLCHANHSTSGWPALMDRRTHYESLNGSIALET